VKQAFIERDFRDDKLQLLQTINAILDSYKAQGYDLTLRQLFYQLVSKDIIPNNQKEYKTLGTLVNDARMAGLIDWDMIVDRGRKTESPSHWDSPADIIEAAARSFAIDKWEGQSNHIEVMVEKQALEGVLIPVCRRLDVNFTANKGYSSQSMMYRIGQRLKRLYKNDDKRIHILYLGDHDPSGLDMDRDVEERLSLFSGHPVTFERLALKYSQVEELRPPENPAKLTDSRADKYIEQYGDSSWELDAVEPKALDQLVTEAVQALRDPDLWDKMVAVERKMKEELYTFAEDYRQKENRAYHVDDIDDRADDEEDADDDTVRCPACGSTGIEDANPDAEDDEPRYYCNNCEEEW